MTVRVYDRLVRGLVLMVGVVAAAVACSKVGDQCAAGCDGAGGTGTIGAGATGGGGGLAGAGGIHYNCGAWNRPVGPLPVDILILLDRSGSMDNDLNDAICDGGCGVSSKWALMTPVLRKYVAASEATTNWGLKVFADPGDAACGVSPAVSVEPGPTTEMAISAVVAAQTKANGGVSNGSRTPTRAAVEAAAAYLSGRTDSNPKFILLVTDGLPTCVAGSADTDTDDSAGAVAAVAAAYAAGIPTFVVGIAPAGGSTDATLSELAQAGGVARAGSPRYYPASSPQQLADALKALVAVAEKRGAQSCLFTLPPPPTDDGITSRDFIEVYLDGAQLPRDQSHTSGWDYADETLQAIVLYGAACDAVKVGTASTVSVTYRCTGA